MSDRLAVLPQYLLPKQALTRLAGSLARRQAGTLRQALLAAGAPMGAGERHRVVLPAYDQCIKASHAFNLLQARGVISKAEAATLYEVTRVENYE